MKMDPPKLERSKSKSRVQPVPVFGSSFFSPNKENQAPLISRGTSCSETRQPLQELNGCWPRMEREELTLSQHEDPSTITCDTALKTSPELLGAHLDAAINNLGEILSDSTGNPTLLEETDLKLSEQDREQAAAQTLLELQRISCLELPPQQWRAPTQRHLFSIPVESAHSQQLVLNGETLVKPQLFIGCTVPPVAENRVGVTTRAQARIGKAQTTSGGMDTTEFPM